MEKVVLKKELSALKAKVEDLQKLVAEESLTSTKPRAKKKMTKNVATHWRESIIKEVSENDGISREKLIRSILPYAKKGRGMYQKLYWFISNMIRNHELVVKGRGISLYR